MRFMDAVPPEGADTRAVLDRLRSFAARVGCDFPKVENAFSAAGERLGTALGMFDRLTGIFDALRDALESDALGAATPSMRRCATRCATAMWPACCSASAATGARRQRKSASRRPPRMPSRNAAGCSWRTATMAAERTVHKRYGSMTAADSPSTRAAAAASEAEPAPDGILF